LKQQAAKVTTVA